jgi:hypothetical protein
MHGAGGGPPIGWLADPARQTSAQPRLVARPPGAAASAPLRPSGPAGCAARQARERRGPIGACETRGRRRGAASCPTGRAQGGAALPRPPAPRGRVVRRASRPPPRARPADVRGAPCFPASRKPLRRARGRGRPAARRDAGRGPTPPRLPEAPAPPGGASRADRTRGPRAGPRRALRPSRDAVTPPARRPRATAGRARPHGTPTGLPALLPLPGARARTARGGNPPRRRPAGPQNVLNGPYLGFRRAA